MSSFDQPTFTARYAGRCGSSACRGSINEGDQITYVDESPWHAECAADHTHMPVVLRSPCVGCWQIPSVSGKCGCEVPL